MHELSAARGPELLSRHPGDILYIHFQKSFGKVPNQSLRLKIKLRGMGHYINNRTVNLKEKKSRS